MDLEKERIAAVRASKQTVFVPVASGPQMKKLSRISEKVICAIDNSTIWWHTVNLKKKKELSFDWTIDFVLEMWFLK